MDFIFYRFLSIKNAGKYCPKNPGHKRHGFIFYPRVNRPAAGYGDSAQGVDLFGQ